MVYLGADHGGYQIKNDLKAYLEDLGYKVTDLGAKTEDPDDDYPVFAQAVAKAVLTDLNNRGILVCRNGAGVCVVANKFPGIRAAVAWNEKVAKSQRNDDNANILCLPADYISSDEAREITKAFLDTSFAGEERFKRRLKQVSDIEKK